VLQRVECEWIDTTARCTACAVRSDVPVKPLSQVIQHAFGKHTSCGVVRAKNQNVYGHCFALGVMLISQG
jgi:hypothetical protein